jgi:hypothetical protein
MEIIRFTPQLPITALNNNNNKKKPTKCLKGMQIQFWLLLNRRYLELLPSVPGGDTGPGELMKQLHELILLSSNLIRSNADQIRDLNGITHVTYLSWTLKPVLCLLGKWQLLFLLFSEYILFLSLHYRMVASEFIVLNLERSHWSYCFINSKCFC